VIKKGGSRGFGQKKREFQKANGWWRFFYVGNWKCKSGSHWVPLAFSTMHKIIWTKYLSNYNHVLVNSMLIFKY